MYEKENICKDCLKTNSRHDKKFTELLQRTFLLKAMGLCNKQIAEALTACGYATDEDAIEKHCERINCFYKSAKGYCSMDFSISKAWYDGDMQRLIKKYRALFSRYIEAFEEKLEINFENLPLTDVGIHSFGGEPHAEEKQG